MDHSPDWRPIEAAPPPGGSGGTSTAGAPGQTARLIALGLVGCAALAALAVVLWLASPQPELVMAGNEASPSVSSSGDPAASVASPAGQRVVVDVEGAVPAPGLYELPPGSRVGDAIEAAGGYGANADLDAAASILNLAAILNDGDKVVVPRLGAVLPTALPAAATASAGTGLIDLNSADEAALDTLPGIGPVTAAKIIGARAEAPFTSVDDLLARGVLGAATLDKIRPLVTVGP